MKERLVRLGKPIIERFPRLAMTYRYLRDTSQIAEDPQDTLMGFKLVGHRGMQDGTFEPIETEIARRIARSVDVVINVGANVGYYCCIALSQEKYVVAFEPVPLNLLYLLRNITANGWEQRVEVFPLALSNRVGVARLYGSGTGASLIKGWAGVSEPYGMLVPTSTLDNVLGARFPGKQCFMIIDIEGAEHAMLTGGTAFIDRDPKPIWMMEICVSEHQPRGVQVNPNLFSTFRMFFDRGYEAWTADQRLRPISSTEVERLAKGGKDTLETHSFLFAEEGRLAEVLHSS